MAENKKLRFNMNRASIDVHLAEGFGEHSEILRFGWQKELLTWGPLY
jgi:hypothetical protein